MPTSTTTYTFDANPGFTFTGADAGDSAWEPGALRVGVVDGGFTFAVLTGKTLADYGLPLGSFVHFIRISFQAHRVLSATEVSWRAGLAGRDNFDSPGTLGADGSTAIYETGDLCCGTGFVSSSAADLGLSFIASSGGAGYVYIQSITVEIDFSTEDYDACAVGPDPVVITPHEATVCTGETQGFTTNISADFALTELGSGSVDNASGTSTTYTAPDWPGTYHLKATAGDSEDTAILTVVDCGDDDDALSSWGSCSCAHSTRQVPAGLLAHLQTEALTLALCLKLVQANGTTLGFTTHDRDLTFDDVTYETLAGVQLSAMRSEIGGSVDNLDLTGLLQSERVSDTDLRAGLYDGAAITLYLVNWSDISDSTQRLVLHRGSLGEVRITDGQYHAEFRSLGQRLQQKVGEAYSPLCRVRQLGDERCAPGGFFADGATLADYQFSGRSVVSVTSGREFVAGGDSHNTGYYNYGRIWFDTGANANIIREVKKHTLTGGNAELVLQEPFPFAIEVGDTLTLEAGCNRTPLICRNRFANMLNFQGEPFITGRNAFKRRGRR